MPVLRRTTAAAAVLSCLPLLPALAVDPVDRSRVAAVAFELVDADGGTVRVSLRVWDAEPADRVDVRVESCDGAGCTYPVFHAGTVDAGTAELDAATASGRAVLALAGHELALDWQPAQTSGAVVSAGDVQASDEAVTGGMYVGAPAAVEVVLAGASCALSGAVGDGARVRLPEGSSGGPRPLEDLRLPGALSCPVV